MSIFDVVEDALETLGAPFGCGVFIPATGEALPDLFLAYQLISSPPAQQADNVETLRSYRIQVSTYSRNGLASLPDVDAAMAAQGFVPSGKVQLPYESDTGHFGLAQDYIYLEDKDYGN